MKKIWAYLDGRRLCEVVQAALDNDTTVADMKKKLIEENRGHVITFRIVQRRGRA